MTQQVKLRRIQIGEHEIYGYRCPTNIDPNLRSDWICSIASGQFPGTIAGCIKTFRKQECMSICDAVYSMESLHLVAYYGTPEEEWDIIADQYDGKELFFLFYHRNTYYPLLEEPLATIGRDANSIILNIPTDINLVSKDFEPVDCKCNCIEKLKFINPQLADELDEQLSTIILIGDTKYHPIFLKDQRPHVTYYFLQHYSFISGDYNNLLICNDEYPVLAIMS
jgi:hypothetical protein